VKDTMLWLLERLVHLSIDVELLQALGMWDVCIPY